MGQPRLLDLFCGAGGAAMGYHRAGFEVVGIDINFQPNYPFEFHQADAMTWPLDGFDAIHASPPCQFYSKGAKRAGTTGRHRDLISSVRERFLTAAVPHVIENIEQARDRLIEPVTLCGAMFGLGVLRHRCFEASVALTVPPHLEHRRQVGDGYVTVTGHTGGSSRRDGWTNGTVDAWRAAMGVHWMTAHELAQAIPPAFTEHIGRQLIGSFEAVAVRF